MLPRNKDEVKSIFVMLFSNDSVIREVTRDDPTIRMYINKFFDKLPDTFFEFDMPTKRRIIQYYVNAFVDPENMRDMKRCVQVGTDAMVRLIGYQQKNEAQYIRRDAMECSIIDVLNKYGYRYNARCINYIADHMETRPSWSEGDVKKYYNFTRRWVS